ncbi:MAG: DNA polymerase III subunit alpha [Nitrospinota bacterium]|nr:DNA polymerase III subunit alpha [Nitrospinota bacterium]
MFVHLNCHSHYSLLAGANRIDDLVQAACGMGFRALALTDTNGLYGAVAFYRAARQAAIKPIFGAEIDEPDSTRRAVLLAKDQQGFGEVCRVISDRQLQKNFSLPERLTRCNDRVIILCPDQETVQAILATRGKADLAVELNRLRGPEARMIAFARQHRLPCVATNRAFFVDPPGWQTHRLLSAIRTGTTVDTLPQGAVVPPDAWLKPADAMAQLFADCPQAIDNTLAVAEQCNVSLPIGQLKMPPFRAPSGETHSTFLEKLVWRGINRLYRPSSSPVTVAVQERVRCELRVIDDLNFASYFLLVWDIVREAHARGIPTIGRGSAANSLVSRALAITEIDPIEHNLYFERFLNPERTDFPDIDIDFPWDRRDEMLDYVFWKYGKENVALISTHIHLRGRSTLREVGKAIGIPIPEIDEFTSRLPFSTQLSELDTVRTSLPECFNLPIDDEPYRSMIDLSLAIEGFPRHLSIHCGGVVVSPCPITDFIPLQKTPKGFVVTQFDMYPTEDMGLLKIDLLAQKGLAVEIATVRAVKQHYDREVDFTRIDPIQDESTKNLIRDGHTIGCFYIESPGMRNLLQKLEVDTLEMLTAVSSIIRPGVSDSGMMKAFIDRHRGREKTTFLHPRLEDVLKNTYGIMIYQEDVLKVAHVIGGMSLGEAEGLRKCMSKKRNWERMETYKERFMDGALRNEVARDIAEEIWRQMESFAGYAFCKAHSASFALVSYRAAYLKAHYPAEFMAAVLSNQGGFYDTAEYVEEARRMGMAILLPHVNHSAYEFSTESRAKDSTQHDAVRVGLMQVKNMTHQTAVAIMKNRRSGPYRSLNDFLARVKAHENEGEALIRSGACDGMGETRPELLWRLRLARRGKEEAMDNSLHLDLTEPVLLPHLPDYDEREMLWAELECLGITVSDHRLALYDIDFAEFLPARELHRYSGRIVKLAGWLVTYKRTRTVKNELMKLMTLEDLTGCFEVTLFPKIYRRFGPLLQDRGPYIVKGMVETEGRCCTVTSLWLGRVQPL